MRISFLCLLTVPLLLLGACDDDMDCHDGTDLDDLNECLGASDCRSGRCVGGGPRYCQ